MAGTIRDTEIRESGDAGSYVIIPRYCVAIPMGEHVDEQIARILTKRADYDLPESHGEYPVVSRHLLSLHFPSYEVVTRLVTVTRSRPSKSMSYLERESRAARMKTARRNEAKLAKQADMRARAVTVTINLDG